MSMKRTSLPSPLLSKNESVDPEVVNEDESAPPKRGGGAMPLSQKKGPQKNSHQAPTDEIITQTKKRESGKAGKLDAFDDEIIVVEDEVEVGGARSPTTKSIKKKATSSSQLTKRGGGVNVSVVTESKNLKSGKADKVVDEEKDESPPFPQPSKKTRIFPSQSKRDGVAATGSKQCKTRKPGKTAQASNDEDAPTIPAISQEEVVVAQKLGKGSRKNPQVSANATPLPKKPSKDEPAAPKRGRGRPRNNPPTDETGSQPNPSTKKAVPSESQKNEVAIPKRGPDRPRKDQTAVQPKRATKKTVPSESQNGGLQNHLTYRGDDVIDVEEISKASGNSFKFESMASPQILENVKNVLLHTKIEELMILDAADGDAICELILKYVISNKKTKTLRSLHLINTTIGSRGATALEKMLALSDCPLHELEMTTTGIGDEEMAHLLSGIHQNTTLKSVKLHGHCIGPKVAGIVGRMLVTSQRLRSYEVCLKEG